MKTYTAKLAQNPQVRSVVSKTMEEWLLPAQLYIQNKFREAFDAVEDQLPEHTVLEPEGNKSSFTVTFPSWKERDDAHAVLANGGVRFRSGKALVPFRITGNIDWGVPVPQVDRRFRRHLLVLAREPVGAHQLYAYRARARCKAAGVTEGVAAQDAALMGEPAARLHTGARAHLPAQLARLARLVVLGRRTDLPVYRSGQHLLLLHRADRHVGGPGLGPHAEHRQRLLPPALHGQKGQLVLADASPGRQTTCSTTTPASRCARTGCRSAYPESGEL